VDIWGRETVSGELDLTYRLHGGQRTAVVRQAEAGIDAAHQTVRRTDLQIVYDVQRMYCAAVMARELHRIGDETLMRLRGRSRSRNAFTRKGRSARQENRLPAQQTHGGRRGGDRGAAGRQRTNGQDRAGAYDGPAWDADLTLASGAIPLEKTTIDLRDSVETAYQFNPDWRRWRRA